jgi:8-oxo-dGTP diphosphatase
MTKRYVLGFAFDHEDNVVLIQKSKPEWQKGKLNGVGGAVESYDASPAAAMAREFREETGGITEPEDWDYRITMKNDQWVVDVFTLNFRWAHNIAAWNGNRTDTDEIVRVLPLKSIPTDKQLISNLPWLIYLCLDEQKYQVTNIE